MDSAYSTPSALSTTHRRELEVESGIAPEIAAERGYWTARQRSEIPETFKGYQRRPGLVIPMHSPDRVTRSYQLKPKNPRRDKKGKAIKYETVGGSRLIADVHPSNMERVRDPDVDLWITEGVKKGDALASRGLCAVALIGVWCWIRDGKLLSCFDHVALDGRRVFVVFDADVMVKEGVQLALERLVGALEARGADVRVVYLPGPQKGVDDYFAAGGTVLELKALARRFEAQDIGRIRLSRDAQLQTTVEDLERRWWAEEWKGRGGHSERDLALQLIEAGVRCGEIHPDGLRVTVSWGTLQVGAKVSRRTLASALTRLEERGFLYRDNEGRKPDKAGAFVLRARVDQYGEKGTTEGKATQELQECDPGSLPLRVPRLQWCSPKWKPSRKSIRKARLEGRQIPEPRPAVKRLGKVRGAVVDALLVAGGASTLEELCEILHRGRPRDLTRRKTTEKGRDGLLIWLADAGIVAVEGSVVSLAPDWLTRLNAVRDLGGEIEADELAETRRRLKSQAYRDRHKNPADRAPTNEELAVLEDVRNNRRMRLALEALRSPGSGPQKNLELLMNGELHNVEYLVRSILRFHKAPAEMLERWRSPVLEAAAFLVRDRAPGPPATPSPDWRTHPLECECSDCLYPEPRYARPFQGAAV